jgi:isocitrate dehydrogenase (NAD+)
VHFVSARRVVVLPGDGVGPAVVRAAQDVLEATGLEFEWVSCDVGERVFNEGGEALPAAVVEAVRDCGVALKGPVATPTGAAFRSVNVALRRALDLYVQVRPVRTIPGIPSPYEQVDVQVVRETTEDLYRGLELLSGSPEARELLALLSRLGEELPTTTGFSLKPQSEQAARRGVTRALQYARAAGRRRVTLVHKASVMPATDGVFLAVGREVAGDYPDLHVDALAVDAAASELVRHPEDLDVLLTTNLYGDVLSDIAAAVTGGLGLAPGANLGDDVAVFEAVHGTAPRHAGADRANPLALVLSAALLLDHLGEPMQAGRVRDAVAEVVLRGEDVTYDLRAAGDPRPAVGTRRAAEAVVELLG